MRLLMGNEAIALGALAAGISLAAGYPGTPSTEVLETIAKQLKTVEKSNIYVEWSVNEKAALELAAGASYAGARTLVTMKQVGLNVAADPLMSLAYVGVKGGMVVLVADDPGPISSQTEQDTRTFAKYSKLPCFDPSSPEEAYLMIQDAFELSEELRTPVIFRPTTRLCHATAPIEVAEDWQSHAVSGFVKDPKWVIFPRLSVKAHAAIEVRNRELSDRFGGYRFNAIEGRGGALGIATGGVCYAYVKEALKRLDAEWVRVLKIATPFPFPYKLAMNFMDNIERVLVFEELDPVIERELLYLAGASGRKLDIYGKEITQNLPAAGEYCVEMITEIIAAYLDLPYEQPHVELPPLPVRTPVLCAGCPHRASFYAVKCAMRGEKAVFCGDIGCYTLGNALPLDMVDTCLCMGAGSTIAQGLARAEEDTTAFAFIGDSTFFASGITGIINAVYNKTDMILVVLDNRITAMTGGQTHPGIGKTLIGEPTVKLSIPMILQSIGIVPRVVNPLDLEKSIAQVREAASESGVRAIVFEYACVNIEKNRGSARVLVDKCSGCGLCQDEIGCPAIRIGETAELDTNLCTGCGLCAQVCPFDAIEVTQ
ncbi:indolepyruvate ferredoxin oxidoreductase subunit alpha [Clostridia bacterium]|nr:indolepyruvate ferredoxin oxidoreductase subunit alpha [Clostridia bacterium]